MIISAPNLMIRYVNPANGEEWGHPLLRSGELCFDLRPGQVMRRITYDREAESMRPCYEHCTILLIDKNGVTIDVPFSTPATLPWEREMNIWRTQRGKYGQRNFKEAKTFNLLLTPCGVLRELISTEEMKYMRDVFKSRPETARAENLACFIHRPKSPEHGHRRKSEASESWAQTRLFI